MKILPPTFCRLPWSGLDVGPQGGFKPCCKYRENLAQDLDSYLSSAGLAQLKQEFLEGKKPPGCQRCWDDEQAKIPSKRQLDEQYTFTDQPLDLSSIQVLSLPFGNTCNLACVTCGSHSSSRWLQDERKLPDRFGRQMFAHSQFYRDPSFLTKLAQISDDVIHIDIPGGEPFFADRAIHLGFLKSLNRPDRIKLHYTTNGTVYPDQEFWQIWKNFRAVDIQISLDGIGDRFEYLRYPANWSKVSDYVLRYLSQNNLQISISHTVSWLNVMYLDEFFDWCETHRLPDPYLGAVSRPTYLDPRCLPDHAKTKILARLNQSSRTKVRDFGSYLRQPQDTASWTQALDWVHELDILRGRDWTQTFAELYELVQNP